MQDSPDALPFDVEATHRLVALFQTPAESRDADWLRVFWGSVPRASLMTFDPQIGGGPDGFPYFQLAIPAEGEFTPYSLEHVLPFALEHGLGAVIFSDPSRERAEFVFSYGDLLALAMTGSFAPPEGALREVAPEAAQETREIQAGPPDESVLPAQTRRALAGVLQNAFDIDDASVAVVVDPALSAARNLAFDLGLTDPERLQQAFGVIAWFVPRWYGLLAVDETFAPGAMQPLAAGTQAEATPG